MDVFISVIIPVYNCENYLRECLDSIANQNVDFEAILIDDGSSDASPMICDEYSSRDKRFKCVHTQNHGPSHARNIGLSMAIGEWVTFVDSDDYIEPGYLNIPSKYSNVDLIFANYRNCVRGSVSDANIGGDEMEYINNDKEIQRLSMQCFDVFSYKPFRKLGSTWGKFFRGNLVRDNNILFAVDLSFYEDACFTYEYFKYINSLAFVGSEEVNYIYRLNEASLTQIVNRNSVERRLKTLQYVEKNILDSTNEGAICSFYVNQLFFILNTISNLPESLFQKFKYLHSVYSLAPIKRALRRFSLGQILSISTDSSFSMLAAPLKKPLLLMKFRMTYLILIRNHFRNGKK